MPDAVFGPVIHDNLVKFSCAGDLPFDPARLGGTMKLARKIDGPVAKYLETAPEGKITLGVSDYTSGATKRTAWTEAVRLKNHLSYDGRSVRLVASSGKDGSASAVLSIATALHNGLGSVNPRKFEIIKHVNEYYHTIFISDIDAYTARDRLRPHRDAKNGMLPPKLAQILINLAGNLPANSRILDPFCGTGVVLQESLLMGYDAYGSDISPRLVDYAKKNLAWLSKNLVTIFPRTYGAGTEYETAEKPTISETRYVVEEADATDHKWSGKIDAVVFEGYLGSPLSRPPEELKLREEKENCASILKKTLKNLASQIPSATPVIIAAPAWLRPDGTYSRLEILDDSLNVWYNKENTAREALLYHRSGQIVARDIIILRKK